MTPTTAAHHRRLPSWGGDDLYGGGSLHGGGALHGASAFQAGIGLFPSFLGLNLVFPPAQGERLNPAETAPGLHLSPEQVHVVGLRVAPQI